MSEAVSSYTALRAGWWGTAMRLNTDMHVNRIDDYLWEIPPTEKQVDAGPGQNLCKPGHFGSMIVGC